MTTSIGSLQNSPRNSSKNSLKNAIGKSHRTPTGHRPLRRGIVRAVLLCGVSMLAGGCRGDWAGSQSAIAPAAPVAERIAAMLLWLTIGATMILVGVMLMTALALFGSRRLRDLIARHDTVVWGGIAIPSVVLALVLIYTFSVMATGPGPGSGEPLRITVEGERWWWRVTYTRPDGTKFETANDVTIPVGRPVEIALVSDNVIHSFWAPRLGGKVDMIPGRLNTMTLMAERPGTYRGQCAEYCGGPHALMAFFVVALDQAAFDRWLQSASGPAARPATPEQQRGQVLFIQAGCGACHTVRGTPADGTIGPDLTNIGSRTAIAAAILPNTPAHLARWIAHNQTIKPENLMPPFETLRPGELEALAAYLSGLR